MPCLHNVLMVQWFCAFDRLRQALLRSVIGYSCEGLCGCLSSGDCGDLGPGVRVCQVVFLVRRCSTGTSEPAMLTTRLGLAERWQCERFDAASDTLVWLGRTA